MAVAALSPRAEAAERAASEPSPAARPLRILMLSWRDLPNPRSGGAEIVTHELAKRWVAWGHSVTLFTAAFPGALPDETIDGVHIIRRGRPWTVHWHAWRWYRGLPVGSFDAAIDHLHGIPFFTPLYVREPVVLYAHEVAREIWFYMYPLPLALLGYASERLILRRYRGAAAIAVSPSTKQDLVRLGLREQDVQVVPNGLTCRPVERLPEKSPRPSMLFVGRLCRMKRVDHLVRALALVRQTVPDAELWLAGGGDERYVTKLRRLAQKLGVASAVAFFGRVSEDQKLQLMQRAWVLASASIREGWGLVVLEVNAMGTPAVVYDVPGFRDSVRNGVTGVLCSEDTPQAMAREIAKLFHDSPACAQLRESAWAWSKQFVWSTSARLALEHLRRSAMKETIPVRVAA